MNNSKGKGKGKDKGKLWDSDDEESSSDEDFNFISKRIQETGELDEETMKLLRGVVHEPYKERKHPERYDRPGAIFDMDSHEGEEDSDLDLNKVSKAYVRPGKQFNIGLDPNEPGISREE